MDPAPPPHASPHPAADPPAPPPDPAPPLIHPRLRLALGVATVAAAVALAVTLLSASGGGASYTLSGAGFAGALSPAGIPPRDFALRDQDGRLIDTRAYRGQVVVVTFLYSTCTTSCPVTAQQIREALDRLGRSVPVLAVSVDPANDTPLNARRFLSHQSMVGRMHFLLGGRSQLQPIWRAYGIGPQTGPASTSDHTAYVALIGKRGRQVVGFPISELTPDGLAHDIAKLERLRA